MRTVSKIAAAALFLAASFVSAQPPDTLWTQNHGDSDWEQCNEVRQTAEGGYILGGFKVSYPGYPDIYLIKTDFQGNLEWDQVFVGSNTDECESVQQTADEGYILGGFTTSYGAGSTDMYLFKTNSMGDSVWAQTFGGSEIDQCYSLQQTSDLGYILSGATTSFGSGYNDMYLVKADSQGIQEWTQTFGFGGTEVCYSVQQTNDNGFILGGYTTSVGAGGCDAYIVKSDSLGNLDWWQTYGGTGNDRCYSIQQTDAGGYVFGGHTTSFGESKDVYLVLIDSLGNMEWQRNFGGSETDECRSLCLTDDGGFLLSGYTRSFGLSARDMYCVKTDSSGNLEWQQTFGFMSDDWCFSVLRNLNGEYVLGGKSWFMGTATDISLFCLEAGGSAPQIVLTLTPENPPIIIPAFGGSFNYNVTASNSYAIHLVFDVWTMVTLPSGSPYGPILGPVDLTLPAETSIDRDRTQDVPPNAPSGDYTYEAYAGVYPDVIWGSDSFSFEKLETGNGVPVYGWTNSGEGFEAWVTKPGIVVPNGFGMLGNHPNPFNPATTISFILPQAGKVNLSIYDISGRLVEMPANGWRNAGVHEVTFNAFDLPSGVYFARLTAGDLNRMRKLVLVK